MVVDKVVVQWDPASGVRQALEGDVIRGDCLPLILPHAGLHDIQRK
jgi:hypothetical protein